MTRALTKAAWQRLQQEIQVLEVASKWLATFDKAEKYEQLGLKGIVNRALEAYEYQTSPVELRPERVIVAYDQPERIELAAWFGQHRYSETEFLAGIDYSNHPTMLLVKLPSVEPVYQDLISQYRGKK